MELRKFTENRFLKGAFCLGLGATVLAGCDSGPGINEAKPATVIGHEYIPGHDDWILVGKVLVPDYIPPEYDLNLRQCDVPGVKGNGCVTGEVSVSQSTYDHDKDGSQIVLAGK